MSRRPSKTPRLSMPEVVRVTAAALPLGAVAGLRGPTPEWVVGGNWSAGGVALPPAAAPTGVPVTSRLCVLVTLDGYYEDIFVKWGDGKVMTRVPSAWSPVVLVPAARADHEKLWHSQDEPRIKLGVQYYG